MLRKVPLSCREAVPRAVGVAAGAADCANKERTLVFWWCQQQFWTDSVQPRAHGMASGWTSGQAWAMCPTAAVWAQDSFQRETQTPLLEEDILDQQIPHTPTLAPPTHSSQVVQSLRTNAMSKPPCILSGILGLGHNIQQMLPTKSVQRRRGDARLRARHSLVGEVAGWEVAATSGKQEWLKQEL